MQGTAKAVDMKNKFLQDVNGPTSHHFSNGPSLNRVLVFQDHFGGERGSYAFNSLISVSFGNRLHNTFIRIESKFEYFRKQVDIDFLTKVQVFRIVKIIEYLKLEYL